MKQQSRRSFAANRSELLADLDKFVGTQLSLLLPVDKCWQPSDLLPDLSSSDAMDQLKEYRKVAEALPDSVLTTLVANMITEEALPSYHAWLCNLETGFDRNGVGDGGMAMWMRGWVAEEKRHGDVLSKYLFATGRVNLRSVELTIHHLLRNGFEPRTENSVVHGFIYTSFQERATFVSHSGVARLARECGEHNLARICDHVAGDEVRHERGYERFVAHMFDVDPDECLIALEAMLRKTIVMPARRMADGADGDVFSVFSAITQRNGIYTTLDYARIMEHLVKLWDVAGRTPITDEGKKSQDYVAALPARYLKLAERAEARQPRPPLRPLPWLFDRVVEFSN